MLKHVPDQLWNAKIYTLDLAWCHLNFNFYIWIDLSQILKGKILLYELITSHFKVYKKSPTRLVWKAQECVTAWFNKCHRFQLKNEIQIFPQGCSWCFERTEIMPILSNYFDSLLKRKSLIWPNWSLSSWQLHIFLSFELSAQLFTISNVSFWKPVDIYGNGS